MRLHPFYSLRSSRLCGSSGSGIRIDHRGAKNTEERGEKRWLVGPANVENFGREAGGGVASLKNRWTRAATEKRSAGWRVGAGDGRVQEAIG